MEAFKLTKIEPNVHLITDGDQCPDCFQVEASGVEAEAAERSTWFRKPGEDDATFWMRVERVARALRGHHGPFGLDRTVSIYARYDLRPSDADAVHAMDDRFNFERVLWRAAHCDRSSVVRVYALCMLADLHGMLAAQSGTEDACAPA